MDSALNLDFVAEGRSSVIARDLRLNLKRLVEDGSLGREDALLALLAVASAVGHRPLTQFASDQLRGLGFTPEQITEASESAAIMGMLNTYYRFKHMVAKEDDYRMAGLRMTSLAKPQLGKQRFEMLALAVSVVNGCESCIRSHEAVLREAGILADQIHDLARLAAVVKGLKALEESL